MYGSIQGFQTVLQASDLQQLSDDAQGDNIVPQILTEMLEKSGDVCDSYLSERYSVPVSTPHRSLLRAVYGIAVYFLHLRRSWTVSDEVYQEYKECMAWLKDVAASKANLIGATELEQSGGFFEADTQRFTKDNMRTF